VVFPLDESLVLAEQTGELWFQAEALRVQGELLRLQAASQAQPEVTLHAAEASLEMARRSAEQRGAKALELRAVLRLCRLWQSRSEGNRGLEMLSAIVDQLGKGLETVDERRANKLLDKLRNPAGPHP
jgi:hypothetical protein